MMESSFYTTIKEELQSSARPIYETLTDSIQKMIADGQIRPGTKFLPDKQMAAALGISHITLAKALNELRRRDVLLRRRSYGTSVRDTQTASPEGTGRKIAVIFDDATEKTFQQDFFLQLHRGLESLGCVMVFLSAGSNAEKQKEQILEVMRDRSISGCIFWSILSSDQAEEILRERPLNYPLISLDKYYPQFDHDAVTFRNFDCGAAVGRMLCRHGFRHVYLVSDIRNRKYTSVSNRFLGVRHGGGPEIRWEEVESVNGKFPEVQWDPEAAVVCGDFNEALLFQESMEQKGLPLPENCCTFETDIEAHEKLPGFTAYRFECEMGKEAVRMLSARLNGKEDCSVNHAGTWRVIAAKPNTKKCATVRQNNWIL